MRQPAGTGEVLLVYALFTHPLRSTIEDHLYAFRRHSARRVHHWNAQAQELPAHLLQRRYDLVCFHTTFLSARWAPQLFSSLCEKAQPLKALDGVRVALPQDEFLHADLLSDFARDFDVDVVCSVAPETEWPKIYPTVDRERVRFHRVLTGYLEDHTVERIERIVAQTDEQDIDLGYRAWQGAPWLGRHGTLKGRIATEVARVAPGHGLRADVSTRDEDTLLGDDWFRFMARCRYTIGVEGGASVLDRDGTVKERTESFLRAHPDASFDEVEAACFPGRDGELSLFALSPRHLEACACCSCQVLVEGSYNGVLRPGEHFIELKADLSNLGNVLATLGDEERRRRIVEAAHREVVASGRWTYRAFVQDVESVALGATAPAPPRPRTADRMALVRTTALERLAWKRIAWTFSVTPRLARWRGHPVWGQMVRTLDVARLAAGTGGRRALLERIRWSRPAAMAARAVPGRVKARLRALLAQRAA